MKEQVGKGTVPGKGYLVFAVTVLLLISTLKVADRELLAPLYAPVSQELGLNDLQFGMVRSAADMALVVGAVVFGLLADRWRRRDVVALGVLCWSAITWGTGRARTFLQLVIVALIGAENWRKPFAYFAIPGVILGLLVLFFVKEPVRGGGEEEVMAAGGYAGHFSWPELLQTLHVRSALLVYLLDACQGSTWWAFSFWVPAYLLRYDILPTPIRRRWHCCRPSPVLWWARCWAAG